MDEIQQITEVGSGRRDKYSAPEINYLVDDMMKGDEIMRMREVGGVVGISNER